MEHKTYLRILTILMAVMTIACALLPVTAQAAETDKTSATAIYNPTTQTVTIETSEDWALIIDGSGSMRELDDEVWDALAYWGFTLESFAYKARFDTELHPDQMDLVTRKDTDIVGAIEKVVEQEHFNRIVVITDGYQDPSVYDALTHKTGVDIHLMVVGDLEAEPEELIEKINEKLGQGCSLTYYRDHLYSPLKEGYVNPTTTIPCESSADPVENEIQELQEQVQALTENIEGMQANHQEGMEKIESQLIVINTQHADHWGICFGEHNIICFIGWLFVILFVILLCTAIFE